MSGSYPFGHKEQLDEFAAMNAQGSQGAHTTLIRGMQSSKNRAPGVDTENGGQALHVCAPTSLLYVPGGHETQADQAWKS